MTDHTDSFAQKLSEAEFAEQVTTAIEAFHNGGPYLEAQHRQHVRELGYEEEVFGQLWLNAAKRKREQVETMRAKLASIGARLEAVKPGPEQAAEDAKEGLAPSSTLPAIIRPRPSPATWDDLLTVMNKQHAIIDNVGGKTVIASWEPSSLDLTRRVVAFQNKDSFLLRYSNRFATIEITTRRGATIQTQLPLSQWWLGHRSRRQYRGITFQPDAPETVNECLNLWQGWGCEPQESDWSLIRNHIEAVLADGNPEFAEYIIRWIAWSIQNPGTQAEVALVLIGEKGAGKGTLVRCLERIFGQHSCQVSSREDVIGKFNGHLQDCVLFVADEAYWGGDKRCVGRLQAMITEPKLTIERKGIDAFEVRNLLHIVMLAEPGWVIPAGRWERRYAAFAVSTARLSDRGYFRALHHQIKNGGAEAMFYDLRKLDLEGWHPREIPKGLLTNPALQKQQSHNLPPLEQWYLTLLHNGKLPGALKARPNTAYTRSLMDDAIERVPRLRWELSDVGLRNFLTDEARIGVICIKYRTAFANGWAFPPLPECREAWSRRYGPTKWDTDIVDWGEPVQEEAKPNVAAAAPARPANTNVPAEPVAAKAAGWRRF